MARVQTVAGYPVRQETSPNRSTDKMSDHRGVVLHIAEGYFEGTISWQMNPDQKLSDGTPYNTCSTWIVGQTEGEIAQMVDSDEVAWCQRAGSRTWLSIELSGYHTQTYLPTPWQRRACAELFLWSHQRYGHVLAVADTDAERGLGHHSMDRETFGIEWGHEQCPGPYVIAAKPDIVRIAQALKNGEDLDDMPTPAELLDAKVYTTPAGQERTMRGVLATLDGRSWTTLTNLATILREVSDDPAVPDVTLTAEQVTALAGALETRMAAAAEAGVREAFAGGLAPDA